MKKIYTKYDYIYIYSKLGVITTTFAVVSISLSLFLGFIVTLAGHAHPDLSSRICFVLFVLMLWLMISYYENIFLILFIFLGSLSLPVLAVMVTYIRLLSFTVNNPI